MRAIASILRFPRKLNSGWLFLKPPQWYDAGMKIFRISFLLLCTLTFGVRADATGDAEKKLAEIDNPPLVITTDTAAGSPTVTVTDKGVWINQSKAPLPYDQVLVGLAALPKEAWPCGRVVYFSASPADPSQGAAPAKADADKIELDLQKQNFRLVHR
jgi:hypothetical protein